jgi:phospholipase/carboxylesterase
MTKSLVRLTGPRVPARSVKADRLVILLHGYGANGEDLISLAPHWQRLLPTTAFSAPNAPQVCPLAPGGYQWFEITRLDPALMSQGVESGAPSLEAYIESELSRHSLQPSQLALVGFSQGTMMALHVGLRCAVPPAAIVGYSGALAGADRLSDEIKVKPPVLLIHGDADEMIPVQALHMAAQALGLAGIAVRWHISRGTGHGIDAEGLELGGKFLSDAFAGRLKA